MLLNRVKKIASILVITVLFCVIFYGCIKKYYIYKNCLDGRLAYKTEAYDERGSIKLEKVIKEAEKNLLINM